VESPDLEVTFAGARGAYRAELREDESTAVANFRMPYTEVELEGLLQQILGDSPRRSSSARAVASALGSRFFGALFKDELGAAFDRALERAAADGRSLRVWFRAADSPEILRIPWELLYDERSRRFLALSGVSIIRSITRSSRPVSRRPETGLRVLVAGSSPSDLSNIDIEGQQAVLDQLAREYPAIKLQSVSGEEASSESLRRVLLDFAPAVVHLAIHVRQDRDEVAVAFPQVDGTAVWVRAEALGEFLADSRSVRLVLLTADTSAPESVAGAPLALELAGRIPAVVSTQFPLTNQNVNQFVSSFYKTVLTGSAIDVAVTEARNRLSFEESSVPSSAWASPVLYMQSGADLSLESRPATAVAPPGTLPTEERLADEAPPTEEAVISDSPRAEEAVIGESAATERIEVGTLGGAASDTVGDEDQLGFEHYVEAFAELITSPHAKPPLTIGIFGSWGMGKSFLLKHIERKVSNRQGEQDEATLERAGLLRVHVVHFNAWEYSATEIVWPALVRKILKKLDEDVRWPWYKRWWTRLKWNLPRQLRRLWVPLVAAALVASVAIATAIWRDHTNLAKAMVAAVGALSLGGLVKAASDPIARWVTALFSESDYGRQIGYMEDIKHDLDTLEARLHKDGDPEGEVVGRILILIDDLDRCEPEKTVEMLQAVNLLLNFPSFIVCLGIDARIVTGAIERHYEGLLGRAGASGYEYLDKIVQIPFRIPEPSEDEVKLFIGWQLGNPPPPAFEAPTYGEPMTEELVNGEPITDGAVGEDSQRPSEPTPAEPDTDEPTTHVASNEPLSADDATEGTQREAAVPFTYAELQAFQTLAPFLRPNPRHLKRLVNVYRLVRALARAKNEELILENPAATIRWLVMWGQWPYTSHVMLKRFEELLDEWGNKIAGDAPVGDPLLQLLDDVRPRLHHETRDRLDDEGDTLLEMLSVEGCALTWEQLRRIRKYTVNFNPAVEEQLRASVGEMASAGRDSG
jgi:hypothetical protein